MDVRITQKVAEIEALAQAEGIELPYPAEMIARLEATGAVVNLITGSILPGEADRAYKWELTVLGEALGVVLMHEGKKGGEALYEY